VTPLSPRGQGINWRPNGGGFYSRFYGNCCCCCWRSCCYRSWCWIAVKSINCLLAAILTYLLPPCASDIV